MLKTNKNKKYILLALIFFITYSLWFYTKLVIQNQQITEDLLINIAQLLGITAVVQLVINFILSTRAYFIEKLFSGLDKMYKFHKANARIAFVLAWSHPILLLLRSVVEIKAFKIYFLPSLDNPFRYNLGMLALYTMTFLVLITLVKFIPYNLWKNTHRLMIFVMLFLFGHVITSPGTIQDSLLLRLWMSFLVIIAICCWVYVEFFYRKYGPVFYYKVSRINNLEHVTELILEPQNKPITYKAGQYVFLSFLHNRKIKSELHPFGLSSNPHDYSVRLSVKKVGDYTTSLLNAKEGDLVKLIGPYGFFTRENFANYKNQIWIAGGIGVVPFLSMLSAEKDEPSRNNIALFYTAKTKSELVYKDELTKDLENYPDIKVNLNNDDENGFLTAQKIKESIDFDLTNSVIMLCGPKTMMHSLKDQFKKIGISEDQIVFEDFALKPV